MKLLAVLEREALLLLRDPITGSSLTAESTVSGTSVPKPECGGESIIAHVRQSRLARRSSAGQTRVQRVPSAYTRTLLSHGRGVTLIGVTQRPLSSARTLDTRTNV